MHHQESRMPQPKTGIQYKGPAGDADSNMMEQSSSQMISQVRQEDSQHNEVETANEEINFYAH